MMGLHFKYDVMCISFSSVHTVCLQVPMLVHTSRMKVLLKFTKGLLVTVCLTKTTTRAHSQANANTPLKDTKYFF